VTALREAAAAVDMATLEGKPIHGWHKTDLGEIA